MNTLAMVGDLELDDLQVSNLTSQDPMNTGLVGYIWDTPAKSGLTKQQNSFFFFSPSYSFSNLNSSFQFQAALYFSSFLILNLLHLKDVIN